MPGEHDADPDVGEVAARAAELAVARLANHGAQVHVGGEERGEEQDERGGLVGAEREGRARQDRGDGERAAGAARRAPAPVSPFQPTNGTRPESSTRSQPAGVVVLA